MGDKPLGNNHALIPSEDRSLTRQSGSLMRRGLDLASEIISRGFSLDRVGELRLDGHRGAITAVSWSPDSRYVISGSEDRTVRVWDIKRGRESTRYESHASAITAVACSPEGTWMASGDETGTVFVWSLETARQAYQLQLHQKAIQSLTFSTEGGKLISSASGGTVSIWDRNSKRELQRLTLDHAPWHTERAVLSLDGAHAISMEEYGTVGLWDINEGCRIAEVDDLIGTEPIGFSPDATLAFYQTQYGSLCFWDTDILAKRLEQDLLTRLQPSTNGLLDDWHDLPAVLIADLYNPSGKSSEDTYDVFSEDKELRLPEGFDDDNGYPVASAVAISPDNRRAIVCIEDHVRSLNLEKHEVNDWARTHEGGVTSVAWSPDGNYIATGGNDNTIRIWKVGEIV